MNTFIQERKWKLSDIFRLLSSSQLSSFYMISSATVILCGAPACDCSYLIVSHPDNFTFHLKSGDTGSYWPHGLNPLLCHHTNNDIWYSKHSWPTEFTVDWTPGNIYLWSEQPAHCAWLGCDCEISVLKLPEAPRPLGQSLSWSALPRASPSQL